MAGVLRRRFSRAFVVFSCSGALCLCFAGNADAATIVVNSSGDEASVVNASCTLREAVQSANTNADVGGCSHSDTYQTTDSDLITLPGAATLSRTTTT
jgi:CSLREA domain-containing protein